MTNTEAQNEALNKTDVIKRLSSYQKLKLENENLKKDIYNLIRKENECIGIETKIRYEIQYRINDSIMMGSNSSESKFEGIFNQFG